MFKPKPLLPVVAALAAALALGGCVITQASAPPPSTVSRTELPTLEPEQRSPGGAPVAQDNPAEAWAVQSVAENAKLNAVWAVDAQHAFAVGDAGLLLKTADGGETWKSPAAGAPDDALCAVQFIDPQWGWALGEKALYTTRDGGETWRALPVFEGLTADDRQAPSGHEHLFFRFTSYTHGTLTGWGRVYVTEDSGETWRVSPFAPPSEEQAAPVRRAIHGMLVRGEELLLMSEMTLLSAQPEGWAPLAMIEPPGTTGTSSIAAWSFPTASAGFVIAGVTRSGQTLFHTTDGGERWSRVTLTHREPAQNIWPGGYKPVADFVPQRAQILMVDAQRGWLLPGGARAIGRTIDGGRTWTWSEFGLFPVQRSAQYHALDARTAYIVSAGSIARLKP